MKQLGERQWASCDAGQGLSRGDPPGLTQIYLSTRHEQGRTCGYGPAQGRWARIQLLRAFTQVGRSGMRSAAPAVMVCTREIYGARQGTIDLVCSEVFSYVVC